MVVDGRLRKGGGTWMLALVLGAIGLLAAGGCDPDDDDCVCCPSDGEAPAAPRGLYSVTGDGVVTLYWLANTEPDLEGYGVYWSREYSGEDYHLIENIEACEDCYWEGVQLDAPNGATRYYAVTAYDRRGNESSLSEEEVWDTARPEGHDVTLSNALDAEGYATAGFDLSAPRLVPADSPQADFWYECDAGGLRLLFAGSALYWPDDAGEIQDMGWTGDFDEISFAPPDAGWSPTVTAEAIAGHTYVLLTRSGNYAKIRVTAASPRWVTFDWALQTVNWNRQLIARPSP